MKLKLLLILGVIGVALYYVLNANAECEGTTGATCLAGQNYSYDDLLGFAKNAGFGCDAPIAAAIAMAESSGYAGAYNPETDAGAPCGKGSVGLWQIYQYKHPEFACMDLYDPQTNANAAFAVYEKAGGFHPWATYNSGAYKEYLPSCG